jgi:hypothetical protein
MQISNTKFAYLIPFFFVQIDVGIVRDQEVDLVITITGGDYTDIADVWEARGKAVENMNGKKTDSTFANINLQTVQGKPKSGEGNFKFCFYEKGTEELTKVDTFRWTVFDADERGGGIKEKMLMDVSQAASFSLWPDTTRSEIKMLCENGTSLPCNAGVRTIFHSSTVGSGGDNPTDPDVMTDQQKSRSITFTFTDTDCWEFTYDHYCPSEQVDFDGPNTVCRGYTGGNFLFSGDSSEIISEGECVVPPPPAPTEPPTKSPTESPTKGPTNAPTDEPTNEPTSAPVVPVTESPTKSPTESPTKEPTNEPTKEPTNEPTSAPVVPITESPTKSPTSSPTSVPITDSPTGSLETLGGDDDDDSFLLPLCPQDIIIVNKSGETDFPADNNPVVNILSQDQSTVTIALSQEWTNQSVDSIFYEYKETIWSTKCYEETDANGGSIFDTITISCNIMTPIAFLEICVADDISNEILSIGDDATLPKCCHSDEVVPPNTPKVCYSLEIRCVSACIDESEQRRTLRGSSSEKN